MEWINYNIAAPIISGEYLCVLKGYSTKTLIEKCVYDRNGSVSWKHSAFGNVGEYITYWMPLPKPPQERREG